MDFQWWVHPMGAAKRITSIWPVPRAGGFVPGSRSPGCAHHGREPVVALLGRISHSRSMPNTTSVPPVSKTAHWIGYAMSALPVFALVMSGAMKVMKTKEVLQGFTHFGYPESTIVPLGITEFVITVIYLIPGTSVLGAILISGYMGGAIA